MRPELIVFLPPVGNQYFGLGQRGENVPVEQFVPQFAVERLNVPILPGAARFNEERLHPQVIQPSPDLPGGELWAIIGANVLRNAPQNQQVKLVDDILPKLQTGP